MLNMTQGAPIIYLFIFYLSLLVASSSWIVKYSGVQKYSAIF